MSNGVTPVAATTDHVTNTATGMVVGGVLSGILLAVGGVVAAPLTAGVSLLGIPAAIIGMGLGGWIGYSHAERKAVRYGFRHPRATR